jgi:hypothetical protein
MVLCGPVCCRAEFKHGINMKIYYIVQDGLDIEDGIPFYSEDAAKAQAKRFDKMSPAYKHNVIERDDDEISNTKDKSKV